MTQEIKKLLEDYLKNKGFQVTGSGTNLMTQLSDISFENSTDSFRLLFVIEEKKQNE